MRMELLDFRKDFIETVKSTAASNMDFEGSAFVNVAVQKMMDAEEIVDFENCYYEGTGRRNRRLCVEGYSFDIDESVRLLISHYNGKDIPETLTLTEVERLFGRLKAFAEEALDGKLHLELEESSPGYGLTSELFYRREQDSIRCIKLYLITDGILSNRIKDLPGGELCGYSIEYHVWDITRFHRVFESQTGRDELQINFREFIPDGIPCLEAGQADGEYKAYLCVIPGEIVVWIYDRYGSRLLEGNVRSFLSIKGKVNKGIRNTILKEPRMFFAYNNGIAATATNAEIQETRSGLRLVHASDLQIVNGGQTTASLLMAVLKDKADLREVFVQMKLSVVSPEKSDMVIPEIARCANSQNKVSEADFFSNHPFHVRFESFSRRIWAPAVGGVQHETHWFYERARGQYLNEQNKLTTGEKKRFLLQNPRNQVITKTDLAKFHNSWNEYPHKVSMGAQKNFQFFAELIAAKWEKSNTDFNEGFYRESVALAILFKQTEKLISEQPWYQHGYRANIVTYTLAKLAHLIKSSCKGKVLDLRNIWSRQSVPNSVLQQLAIIAEEAFRVIVSPEVAFQNVTEWCKKERCWELIRNREVAVLPELYAELTYKAEITELTHQSRTQQKIDNGIEAQSKVVELGSIFWEQLRSWGVKKKLLTFDEEKLLRVACRISGGMMPTDKQSIKLLNIKNRLEQDGFTL